MKNIDLTEWLDWIDGQDVLLKMNVAPRTLQRWRINGLLPYSRVSGKCYYKKSDIIALLNENYNREKSEK
ncbi:MULTISPECIES: helix-turn-helix domain-containing protein [Proteiniphilum]|uniref:helix-turn-helix domain-containing protein n=1 Tax=Proteiniphilum TaxID=294702 RepID=UPI0003604D3D|nr:MULTISPECIES: helix-turn-helix domain-containing protein [Proteiniphilum]MDY9918624.1 helix-turn-helix domain-containing protein [Proteiniphilum sp.]SEA15503.1 Helix-turn-helix domain-containing protein [Porphyromonadaceae bacterium KH3R12]